MAEKRIDQLPDAPEIGGDTLIAGFVGGVTSKIYLALISAFVRGEISVDDLVQDGQDALREFLTCATEGQLRAAIGAEQAGTASTLISGLAAIASSGDAEDIVGATAIGKSLITTFDEQSANALLTGPWRYIDDAADNVLISLAGDDTRVLIEADGWANLRLALPGPDYSGQEIIIATTGTVAATMFSEGTTVIEPITFTGGVFQSTFSYVPALSGWLRTGYNGAQAGGPTRFINDLLEGTILEILDTDSLVLLEADGWASVRLSMPNGLYDGHTIRVATTGAIGALYAIYGADVINPTPSTTYPDGFACTFIWFYDNAQWVRFG